MGAFSEEAFCGFGGLPGDVFVAFVSGFPGECFFVLGSLDSCPSARPTVAPSD